MRIDCPYCGSRDSREFTILGDAAPQRPGSDDPNALNLFCSYVYDRDNPAGLHRELWYHGPGCQAWLVVSRNTLTHRIEKIEAARVPAIEGGAS